MDKLLKDMRQSFDILENKIKLMQDETNFKKPMELKDIDMYFVSIEFSNMEYNMEYKLFGSYSISEKSKKDIELHNGYRQYSQLNTENIEKTIKALNTIKENSIESHNYNIKAVEHNKKCKENLIELFKNLGFTDYRYESYGKRSQKSYRTTALWVNEIEKHYPTEYEINIDNLMQELIDKLKNKLKEYNNKLEAKKQEKEKQKAIKESKKKFAILCSKYDLDYDSEPYNIKMAIIEKDKYLYAAHYLLENRNDWNDGYSYAKQSFKKLDSSNATDILIINEIQSIIDSGDIDGRHFRDCNWNYDKLFGMANNELVKDYNIVTEIEDYIENEKEDMFDF
jgi:hypothetical protein